MNQPVPDAVILLGHDSTDTTRTIYRRSAPVQDVKRLDLEMISGTGLPFAEEWHLLALTRSIPQPGADEGVVEHSGDPGWVRDHTGELGWITIRRTGIALPSSTFGNFPLVSTRSSGAVVLSRVEDDDEVLPWTVDDCNPVVGAIPQVVSLRAAPPGAVDCFDMQTLPRGRR